MFISTCIIFHNSLKNLVAYVCSTFQQTYKKKTQAIIEKKINQEQLITAFVERNNNNKRRKEKKAVK